ncbi:type I 3-dehydroquinate dehydratase [Cellulomonas denverensis]|uniref:3-dehydroquinate dehydratase n=1 Tax=Cellulomonas denverensis TaxID=264297 RepID=A0A7X6KXD0_9CELL|nr:type I 3-dehydroquinate dehydratase [Cellulomonas denverensis]NKY23660.1 type I 3-dehydroquinate dehydratase [Cellulomonas denverensis]GIG26859.1 3-dehydroquinate dehydratase [Cellulomonas denverensis]
MTDLDARRPVTVRGVTLGTGTPAVIVPLTARTPAELVAQAAPVVAARPDLVEWRVDHLLAGGSDLAAVVEAGRALVAALDGLPLLATIRTGAEGGELPMPGEEYLVVYRALLEAGIADLVDVELRHATAARVIAAAHDAGVPVVASNHDFDGTPDREEIERRLLAMAEQGADVLKIAVMPRSPEDVLTLLSATLAVRRRVDQPLITMAMAGTGVVSRLAGGVFGSAATFGTVGAASAPGQVEVDALRRTLALVHQD